MKKDIITKIRDEVNESIKEDLILYQQEQDFIQQIKLYHRIEIKVMKACIDHLTTISDSEFIQLHEALSNPIEKQFSEFLKNEKEIAFDKLETSEQFEQYKTIRELDLQHNEKVLNLFHSYDFDKKSLERLLIFYITSLGKSTIGQQIANLRLYPLSESSLLVNRLFGFDINWLMGMSMIQL